MCHATLKLSKASIEVYSLYIYIIFITNYNELLSILSILYLTFKPNSILKTCKYRSKCKLINMSCILKRNEIIV